MASRAKAFTEPAVNALAKRYWPSGLTARLRTPASELPVSVTLATKVSWLVLRSRAKTATAFSPWPET